MLQGALSGYALDNCSYPNASDISQLRTLLTPEYLSSFPELDGWGRPFIYKCVKEFGKAFGSVHHASSDQQTCSCERYRLVSLGADGRISFDVDEAPLTHGPSDDPATDIVLDSGNWIRWPEPKGGVPLPSNLPGRYELAPSARAQLSKMTFYEGAGGPAYPGNTFRYNPGTVTLEQDGSFSALKVPRFDTEFFVYGGERSLTGTWRTRKVGPDWYVLLRRSGRDSFSEYYLRVGTGRREPNLVLDVFGRELSFGRSTVGGRGQSFGFRVDAVPAP